MCNWRQIRRFVKEEKCSTKNILVFLGKEYHGTILWETNSK
jgi:hypothetical protein